MTNTSEDDRSWYDRLINALAAGVVLAIWYFTAWGMAKLGWVRSEERVLMWIVAANLAVHLHKVRR